MEDGGWRRMLPLAHSSSPRGEEAYRGMALQVYGFGAGGEGLFGDAGDVNRDT